MIVPYTDDPLASLADRVRFYLGDTATVSLLSDSEVDFLLEDECSNALRAAARGAEILSAKSAGQAEEKKVGPLTIANRRQSQADRYRLLAKTLWARAAASGGVAPFAGGISKTDKLLREMDGDRTPPIFTRDMMIYTRDTTSQQATDEDLRP
jgi:hypothetical protein